jgi:hypothetical protein
MTVINFFNTTNETGETLSKYSATAKSQQERIYDYMKTRRGVGFAPSQILDYVFSGENVPITSIRRAMTNLSDSKNGSLISKTDIKYRGPMGRPEHTWAYIGTKETMGQGS